MDDGIAKMVGVAVILWVCTRDVVSSILDQTPVIWTGLSLFLSVLPEKYAISILIILQIRPSKSFPLYRSPHFL
jgi:hypothetical protein